MNAPAATQIERALFDAALDIEDGEVRRDFLSQACGDDTPRLARLHRWLDTRKRAEDFFRDATIPSWSRSRHRS